MMFLYRIINYFSTNVNNFLLKTGIFLLWVGATVYILYKLITVPLTQYVNWLNSIQSIQYLLLFFVIVFLLSFINWGFESLKWQLLAGKLQKISFFRSYKGVLLGVAMGMITPKRLGEFAGKAIVLDKPNRVKGAIINVAGTTSQLLITLITGAFSLLILFYAKPINNISVHLPSTELIIPWVIIFLLTAILFLFRKRIFAYMMNYSLFYQGYKKLLVLKKISKKDFYRLLALSFLRYTVFMTQCFLLFIILGLQLSFPEVFLFQSVVFLLMTMLPVTAFSELAVKGGVAIVVFSHIFADSLNSYHGYEMSLIFANGLIWMINLAVPALAGIIWGADYGLSLKKSFISVK